MPNKNCVRTYVGYKGRCLLLAFQSVPVYALEPWVSTQLCIALAVRFASQPSRWITIEELDKR